MMSIRKSKRLSIYKKMLNEYKESNLDNYTGFCIVLSYINKKEGSFYHIEKFPELIKYKPHDAGGYWWSIFTVYGRRRRIEILKKIIVEMSQKKS